PRARLAQTAARSRKTGRRSARVSASSLPRCRPATADHDVPSVAERPFGDGRLEVELRDHELPTSLVRDRVEDRVEGNQGVAWKIHLRQETARERRAKEREMKGRRTPRSRVTSPLIGDLV